MIAVRTSDVYRFVDDPAVLWTWFLTVNRLVAPLGLRPFKDCFFSNPEPDLGDSISGDEHAELEALLSALSGGPIGIGDRIGRTDREIVMRTCNDDGTIRHVDRPIGLIDECLLGAPARGDRLAWSTASTTVNDQTWTYVVAINTAPVENGTLDDELSLAEIGVGANEPFLIGAHRLPPNSGRSSRSLAHATGRTSSCVRTARTTSATQLHTSPCLRIHPRQCGADRFRLIRRAAAHGR